MNYTGNFLLYMICSVIISTIISKLPVRWFGKDSAVFRMHSFEKDGDIYDKVFGISLWKDALPEMAQMNDGIFQKKSLNIRNLSPEYIQTFINETRRAEMTHFILIVMGIPFAILNEQVMGFFMMATAVFLNFPFLMLQRYNRPRLQRLLTSVQNRKQRTLKKTAEQKNECPQGIESKAY